MIRFVTTRWARLKAASAGSRNANRAANPEPIGGLLPVRFHKVGGSALVHLIDPADLNFSLGFLSHELDTLPDNKRIAKIMPVADWKRAMLAQPSQATGEAPLLIFHISRCGSTLLAQNLKAAGNLLVLGEPDFVNIPQDVTSSDCSDAELALLMIKAWQRYAASRHQRLAIKFSSSCLRHFSIYNKALPNAPTVLLYRAPLAVLESLARSTPPFLRKKIRSNLERDLPEGDLSEEPAMVAEIANHYCDLMAVILSIKANHLIKVDYTDLASRFGQILRLCGLQGAKVKWASRFNSKHPSTTRAKYVAADDEAIGAFAKAHQASVDQCQRLYDQMEHSVS